MSISIALDVREMCTAGKHSAGYVKIQFIEEQYGYDSVQIMKAIFLILVEW